MIDVELKVVSDHRDGLLTSLGEVLIANQFKLLRHRRLNTANGVVMSLVVQGDEANLLRLEEQLGGHWMVNSFEAARFDPDAAAAPLTVPADMPVSAAPTRAAAPAAPAPTESSGTYDQKRIEALLPQIARDYPQVFGSLLAMERGLAPEHREASMRYIGTRVGAWVFKRDFALGTPQALAGSIAHIALPALKQLMPTRQEGDALLTSGSPFASPDHRASVPKCHFVRGFLEGALNAAGHLGVVQVVETSCRGCGSEACKFEFRA